MLIKREKIPMIKNLIESLKLKRFSIQTQYKFLKIKKAIDTEQEIYEEQLRLLDDYMEKDANGNVVVNEDGGAKIKEGCLEKCQQIVYELNKMQIQVPDIYLSLEELEPLGLTFDELELLEVFIKM